MLEALRLLGRVSVARDVRIARDARVEVARGARLILGPGAVVGPGARITVLGGTAKVGAGARLDERSVVVSHAGVEIGEGAIVGAWAAVDGSAPTFADVEQPVRAQPLRCGLVTIGAGAVIGAHAVIGAGAIVAPRAVVEPYAVVREAISDS